MAKFTLVHSRTTRNPHNGLICVACYKENPNDSKEVPHRAVFFNRHAPVEIEADLIEYELDGVYKKV